jgi:ubiquinone/menaquinone biosynthesis C-methylase UbiE
MAAEQAAMERRLRPLRAICALDLGAGTGRYTAWLLEQGVPAVASVDQSMAMLTRNSAPRAWRVRADGLALPFGAAQFDLVVAGLVAGDIADLPAWLSEIRRVLRPGGHCVYSDFHPEWQGRGWRRTFVDAAGRVVELPVEAHTCRDHGAASTRAGFTRASLDTVLVPPPGHRRRLWQATPARLPALIVVSLTVPEPVGCGGTP